ncbi:hypothetical protein [Streptomyces sp. TP-A0356]|uniref:hypothetical protein n=1 Tax=Streptomyces sp. TP-A0356 TaxID=1359208 RepID=UPI0006E18E9A|nr:hypothetical protein [Streptomyces sp. TP-A0356]
MTAIEELLARALLLDEPAVPRDLVPRDDAGIERGLGAVSEQERDQAMAANDLQALCEALLAHTTATSLGGFVTEHLPEPPGARILGCILQLADADDSARTWWQYAAGAGDDLASYCLYLHHLKLGDRKTAAWWGKQTCIDTRPSPQDQTPLPGVSDFDASVPTVLRVLARLDEGDTPPRTEVVDAVMHYVPSAVAIGYLDNPEFEMPLPRPDFAEHISILLAATTAASAMTAAPPRQRRPLPRLPGRQGGSHPQK